MNQEQRYAQRIKTLEREIRNLKTSHVKTATTISTMYIDDSVSFSLMLDPLSGNIVSTQRAILTLSTTDGTNMLSACYINNASPVGLNDRTVEIIRLQPQNGNIRFGIAVFSQNINDYNTLAGGGSVNLTYNIRSVGTSNFITTIDYKAISGGAP